MHLGLSVSLLDLCILSLRFWTIFPLSIFFPQTKVTLFSSIFNLDPVQFGEVLSATFFLECVKLIK